MFLASRKNLSPSAAKCRKKFLKFFPQGYYDETYIAWEREYKWNAHLSWEEQLNRKQFSSLLKNKDFRQIAMRAVNIESRTNLLFSFEKMALRDATKSDAGAEEFATGLFEFLHGRKSQQRRFEEFVTMI